ncbi:MAG: metal ABC transporter ATP-binding protein [Candidatus Woesearchaeota archaeon]
MNKKDIAIKLKDLEIGFVDYLIAKNVSLSIKENEFVLVTGPKNSGKTTFIETIIGLIKPLSGHIHVFNNRTFLDYKHLIGYIPQDIKINYGSYNILDVVLMGIISKKPWFPKITKKDKSLAKESLKNVGLDLSINTLFSELSQSDRIKCLIARALVDKQKILILDEIESGLDFKSKSELLSLLNNLKEKKDITFLVSTKEFNLFNSITDKVIFLAKDDKKLSFGEPKDIITNQLLNETYNTELKSLKLDKGKVYINYN